MRDDFPEDVKRALANRAAQVCSNPDCRAKTSGPQDDPTKAINIGVAGHITAASPGGPRFVESLTPEQRRAASNGIWLCQNCAKMVDNDQAQFDDELLRAWKVIRERAALREIGQTATITGPETDSAKKYRRLLPLVNTRLAFILAQRTPYGQQEYVPQPVTLLECNELYIRVKFEGSDSSRSIPIEDLQLGWDDRLNCTSIRVPA